MVHVEDWLLEMLGQDGDRYVFGAETDPNDPDPQAFDCSELIEWASARAGVDPRVPDGSWLQWAHVQRHGLPLPLDVCIGTRGALLFIQGSADRVHHVAVSLGDGTTVEARGAKWGVGSFTAHGRFEFGGLLPGIDYAPRPPVWPIEEVIAAKEAVEMGAGNRVVGAIDAPTTIEGTPGTPGVDCWLLLRNGGIVTAGRAPFHGSYWSLPDEATGEDDVAFGAITPWVAPEGVAGYAIWNDAHHAYRFPDSRYRV